MKVLLVSSALCLACSLPPAAETTAEVGPARKNGPVLAGNVTDRHGEPVEDVTIILYGGFATRWEVGRTRTDAAGAYRFDPCPQGGMIRNEEEDRWDYYLGMRLEHTELTCDDGSSWWDVTVAGVDREVTRRNFRLVPGGTINGRVVDERSGRPVEVSLRIHSTAEGRDFMRYADTDADGRFEERALHPGKYVIDVNSPRERYPVLGTIEILASQVSRCELEYAPAGG